MAQRAPNPDRIEERIIDALYGYPANAHNPVKAVRALLEEAWVKGYHAGGTDMRSHEWGQRPNPYETKEG